MSSRLAILQAVFEKRWTLRRLRTHRDVELRQQRLLGDLMRHARQNFSFYRGASGTDFNTWPIVDKSVMMREFAGMNAHGISREAAWEAAERGLSVSNSSGAIGDLTLGTSTGTSGQRGLFMVSSRERAQWLGSIVARCLPDFPFVKHRVAVLLATGNELYQTANASGRLAFSFHDLRQGLVHHIHALEAFKPDVLVAPPKAVRALAEAGTHLPLNQLFTGGEVLDPLDALPIENWFGVKARPIYQATEGFLGVACEHGRVHLNEDDMLFEEESVPGHPDHFVPIITDLRRRSQAMIRYRLNDVLVKAPGPCPCGSVLVPLLRVEGRCDDVLAFKSAKGDRIVQVMPEALRVVILDSDRGISDFRLVQKAKDRLELQLPTGSDLETAQRVTSNLQHCLGRFGADARVSIGVSFGIEQSHVQKLRRIRNECHAVS